MSPSTSLGTGLVLYAHPFSSFSWKALIPLWADDTPFTYRNVDHSDPAPMAELRTVWHEQTAQAQEQFQKAQQEKHEQA